jgi:hypothetical protein
MPQAVAGCVREQQRGPFRRPATPQLLDYHGGEVVMHPFEIKL